MMRLILIWANVTSLTGDFNKKEKNLSEQFEVRVCGSHFP